MAGHIKADPLNNNMKAFKDYIYNEYLFLKSWFDDPKRMGTLFPSFACTGKTIASVVKDPHNSRVLELGAGTGQVTTQLISAGVSLDKFATVEADKNFCEELRKKLPQGTNVLNIDARTMAETLPPEFIGKTDYIVSTLPLIALGEENAKKVINQVFKVLKPGGVYIQITFSPFKPKYMKKMGLKATKLCVAWINLPPTHIWRICRRVSGEMSMIPEVA
eukprot:TRINITY_DN12648_c0_g1_i3.p1 TRINITY_DN12648_c0_g1~~TRINITY_DN12648_c0_g1_i3.p1  ORF type:complete len:219 (-),score=50.67 TRINITY_DN12648_c0_g1_i3:177-833(-)